MMFSKLKIGDKFMYGGELFMKIDDTIYCVKTPLRCRENNAVSLVTGRKYVFGLSVEVERWWK